MNILEQIVARKRQEVELSKKSVPIARLEKKSIFSRSTFSMREFIQRTDKTGIIAEFKRRSPSKGVINAVATIDSVVAGYERAGASAVSVLTDRDFFGGSNADLEIARGVCTCPVLRKDFTIDDYQVIEAKAIGADAILLIAAVLTPPLSKRLTELAHSLQLEVLLEVHDKNELDLHGGIGADLIGVNNRDLKTFKVSLETSKELSGQIPVSAIKVSESGISDVKAIAELKTYGFQGFLIGENFMKDVDPGRSAAEFMETLKTVQTLKGAR